MQRAVPCPVTHRGGAQQRWAPTLTPVSTFRNTVAFFSRGSRFGEVVARQLPGRARGPGLALPPVLLTQGCCQRRDPLDGDHRLQPPKRLLQPQPQAWPSARCPSVCQGPSRPARECSQPAPGRLQTRSSCEEERARRGGLSDGLSPDNLRRSRRGQLPPHTGGAAFQSSRSLVPLCTAGPSSRRLTLVGPNPASELGRRDAQDSDLSRAAPASSGPSVPSPKPQLHTQDRLGFPGSLAGRGSPAQVGQHQRVGQAAAVRPPFLVLLLERSTGALSSCRLAFPWDEAITMQLVNPDPCHPDPAEHLTVL